MFEDYFVESHTVRNSKGENIAFAFALIFVLLVVLVLINGIPLLLGYNLALVTGSVSVLLIWGTVILITRRSHVEYEIEIVNDIFDGAKIMGKNKREELCEFSIKDCQAIGPVTSSKFSEFSDKALYRLNLTSNKNYPVEDGIWFAMTGGTSPYMVIFEMKPDMYKVFRRFNPRHTEIYHAPKNEDKGEEE
ncbi:MAG: hypothetical protein J6X33_10475 [Clostridiales bacterium]|nr:hypothetical protein [Clostridiales bacterium]